MIKRSICAHALLLAVIAVFCSDVAQARQQPENHPLLSIQQAYIDGDINIETAVMQQFQVLEAAETGQEILKCATPALMFFEKYKAQISSSELHQKASQISASAAMQSLHISPMGKFQINYDTTGSDAVPILDENANGIPDYVEWVAEAADSSYRFMVLETGFPDPIPAGYYYQVYLEDMGFYGLTSVLSGAGPLTYITIENDFEGFPLNTDPDGNQIGSIRATMAHEFKHAIQYIQNSWLAPTGTVGWIEMDATLMEEIVYDDVNDYYNYIRSGANALVPSSSSVFGNPSRSIPGGYHHVTWMLYYSETLGFNFWKDVWHQVELDNSRTIPGIMESILPDGAAGFNNHFVRSHLWHYASGEHASEGYGFREKDFYPNPKLETTLDGVPTSRISFAINSLNRMAARYFEIIPASSDRGLVEAAINFDSTQAGLGLLLYMHSGSVEEIIATGQDKVQIYVPTTINWQDVAKVGVIVANPSPNAITRDISIEFGKQGRSIEIKDPDYSVPDEIMVFQNYPNPFNPKTTITFELSENTHVVLEVFDILGRKVRTLVNENRIIGRYEEEFDAAGLASGMYIYRLQTGSKVLTKKMMLTK